MLLAGCSVPQRSGDDAPPLAVAATPPHVTATLAPTFTPPATATLAPTQTPIPTATAIPSATPLPSATLVPSVTPTVEPLPTAEPSVTVAPSPAVAIASARQVLLSSISHDYQRLNNCGPTTAAMALSHYGLAFTQYDIAPLLKGADTDKNVAPEELSAYLQAQGFQAPIRVNGDLDTLRTLLANNIPVIIEQWLERSGDPLTGHYRLARGYDQDAGTIIVNDSYLGPNLSYPEATFDRWWRAFNRLYIPVYRPDQEPLVRAIVGEAVWEPAAMWQAAGARAGAEVASSPDLYGWFNLGTARLRQGDAAGAVQAFDQAIVAGLPERMLWYQFGPFEAFNVTGQWERTLQLSQPLVGLKIEEVHFHRGVALEGLGRAQEALAEYQSAVTFNARYAPAATAAQRLGGG